MADCTYCLMLIKDPEKSTTRDGEHWFCSDQCLGLWTQRQQQDGGIPA